MSKVKLTNEIFNVSIDQSTGQQFPSDFNQAMSALNGCLKLSGSQFNEVVKINRLLEAPTKDYDDTRKKIQDIYLKENEEGEKEIPEDMTAKKRKEMNDKFKDLQKVEFELDFKPLALQKKKREMLRIPPGHMATLEKYGIVISDFNAPKEPKEEKKK